MQRKDGSILIGGSCWQIRPQYVEEGPAIVAIDSATFKPLWSVSIDTMRELYGWISQLHEQEDGTIIATSQMTAARHLPDRIFTFDTKGDPINSLALYSNNRPLETVFLTPAGNGEYSGVGTIYDYDSAFHFFKILPSAEHCLARTIHPTFTTTSIAPIKLPESRLYPTFPLVEADTLIMAALSVDSITIQCSGINTIRASARPSLEELTAYPNPAIGNSSLRIRLPEPFSGPIELALRNATGQCVYSERRDIGVADVALRVETTGLSKGLYYIEIMEVNSYTLLCRSKTIIQ